jgi:large subunit ribosomal protein L29
MATKNFIDLQGMTVEAIETELTQARTDLEKMRFDHGSKGLQNPLELRSAKKDIARMLTELRSREVSAMSSEELSKRSKIRLRRK